MLELNTPATKKWKLNELSELVDSIENKVIEKTTEKPIPYIQDYNNIILDITGKSLQTIREVIMLCAGGYPDGALSLARNLYEQLIIVCFLQSIKDEANSQDYYEDYFLDFDCQRYKNLKLMKKYNEIDQSEEDEIKDLSQKLSDEAHKDVKKGVYWWTGKATFQSIIDYLAEKVDPNMRPFFNKLHLEYKRACLSIHSNSFGNVVRLGSKAELYVIDNSAKMCGQSMPLSLATTSFVQIVVSICEVLDIDYFGLYKDRLSKLIAFFEEQGLKDEGLDEKEV